jgi:hypothetical protein
MTYHICIYI